MLYDTRHYYEHYDKTFRRRWFRRKKAKAQKKLKGNRNEVVIGAFYEPVMEFMIRHTKLPKDDIVSFLYVAKMNRCFSKIDVMRSPNKYGRDKTLAKLKEWMELGFIEKYENAKKRKATYDQYVLTKTTKALIDKFDRYVMCIEKIPLNPLLTDEEFVNPLGKKKTKTNVNWYASILEQHKTVDKNKDEIAYERLEYKLEKIIERENILEKKEEDYQRRRKQLARDNKDIRAFKIKHHLL